MAQFGVSQPGQSVTATTAADTILFYNDSATAVLSQNSILGIEGDDIISFGAQGLTASAQATLTLVGGIITAGSAGDDTGLTVSSRLIGSATYTGTTAVSGIDITTGAVVVASANGVVTAERAVRSFAGVQIFGNQGNDTIAIGDSVTTATDTTIGGGAGNDFISNNTYVNGALTGANVNGTLTALIADGLFVEGGGGNDTVNFLFSGTTFGSSTVQGSQGNDVVTFDMNAGSTAQNSLIALGGGNDAFSGDFQIVTSTTIAGGGGNDSITFTSQGVQYQTLIALDTFNSLTEFDGNDVFSGEALGAYSAITINAGGGNDFISFSGAADQGSNLYQLNAGDDTVVLESLSSSTVQAGAGVDRVEVDVDILGNSLILGGGGDDQILFSAGAALSATLLGANVTVNGGAGADTFFSGNELSAGLNLGSRFAYSTFSDSTLSAMDTIAVTGGSGQIFNFAMEYGGLSLANQDNTAQGLTATNGVVQFSAAFQNNLTARVEAIDAAFTTVGTVAAFVDGNANMYLFVQGGSTDQITQVGSTTLSAGSTQSTGLAVTLGGGNTTVQFTT